MNNFQYFRNRLINSKLYKTKNDIRERKIKQIKSTHDFFIDKFSKTTITIENQKMSKITKHTLLYKQIDLKHDNKFMIRVKTNRQKLKKNFENFNK